MSDSEVQTKQKPHPKEKGLIIALEIIIVAVVVYPLIDYAIFQNGESNHTAAPQGQVEVKIPRPTTAPLIVIKQPCSLRRSHTATLTSLCLQLYNKHAQCTPADLSNVEKHKVPLKSGNTASETRGTIVGFLAAGLLLMSLGAACLELYKAKSQTPVKQKTTMSRKCSLADLTVLKHTRKELSRRESILEIAEGPMKPLASRPAPLHRRCSFPDGPNEALGLLPPDRRVSIVETRRNSIRKASIIDVRSVSLDSSDYPRHWSRLVHRH